MSLLKVLSIADIYSKVYPPYKTVMLGMLRSTSNQFKTEIDNMSLEVHIKINSSDIDNIIKNIKEISKNYTITKIKFSKSYTILMFINLDIIRKLCPFLTHLDLGSNNFNSYRLQEFKTNLPKCNVIQDMFSYNCKRVKETREYTFGTTYYYEWYYRTPYNYNYNYNYYEYTPELKYDRDVVLKLAAVQLDNIQEEEVLANVQHKAYTKLARNARKQETKALSKRFRTNKSQYNTNALNQRYQKKY